MGKKKPSGLILKCPKCGADLTQERAVTREYVSDRGSDFISGHYDDEQMFDPDQSTSAIGSEHDGGDDYCAACDAVIE